jgi:serine phosphatase RsbU (regulator of sigma subunit)
VLWPVDDSEDRGPSPLLVYEWPGPIDIDDALLAAFSTVAQLCGQTLERARLYDAEHALVTEFQQMTLQKIPNIDGLEVSAKYLPAGPLSRIGGDFYDSVRYDDHRLAIVVGDITGHGIEAAARMIQIRTKLHTLLSTGASLRDVFSLADQAIASEPHFILATAVVLLIDTATDELSFVTAGHPPLLLRRPDGRVERLDGARRSLLGVPAPPVVPRVVAFGPGSSVLAYTDGLFERPHEPLDVGIDALAEALAATPDVHAIVGVLGRSATGRDDIAAVLASRRSPPA